MRALTTLALEVEPDGRGAADANERATRWPGLDGLRGFAAIGVCIWHVELHASGLSGGSPGTLAAVLGRESVRIFFVLSGFLIGKLSLAETARQGTFDVRAFYKRRAFRIVPVYALTSLFAFLVLPSIAHSLLSPKTWQMMHPYVQASADGLASNAPWYAVGLPQIAYIKGPHVFGAAHLWSVGVEMAFYAIWPALFAVVRGRPSLMFVVAFASAATQIVVVDIMGPRAQGSWIHVREYFGLCSGYPFYFGVGIAFLSQHVPRLSAKIATGLSPWGSVVLIGATLWAQSYGHHPALQVLAPLMYAIALVQVMSSSRGPFCSSFLRHMGKISYSFYCIHVAIMVGTLSMLDRVALLDMTAAHRLLAHVVVFAASASLASLIFRWIEGPCIRLAQRHQ